MIDIKLVRENPDAYKKAASQKNIKVDIDLLLELDTQIREAKQAAEVVRVERNTLAAQAKSGKPTPEAIARGKELKEALAIAEGKLAPLEKQFLDVMVKMPTIPSPDSPEGKDDSQNVEALKWGTPRVFDFKPLTHSEIAERCDLIDFEKGNKTAGFRGYYLKNEGARLVMALMMFAVDKMSRKGYTVMIPPTLVRAHALFGSGYFKGAEFDPEIDEVYQVASSDKEKDGTSSKERKFLVGTAEPSLLAYYADETLKESELPVRVAGFSSCYRSEIGSYSKDVKGLYRVHEFFKVEQVVLCRADLAEANALQEEMVGISREIHEDLGLPYRLLSICTGDMSSGKYKAFDIEAWMPGLDRYGETGSASNFLDWQARRLNARYAAADGSKKFLYMLNNTALPSPRPLIAILENGQNADGSVTIPEVLRMYMGGQEKILPRK